jgi:hypothetical protein
VHLPVRGVLDEERARARSERARGIELGLPIVTLAREEAKTTDRGSASVSPQSALESFLRF